MNYLSSQTAKLAGSAAIPMTWRGVEWGDLTGHETVGLVLGLSQRIAWQIMGAAMKQPAHINPQVLIVLLLG